MAAEVVPVSSEDPDDAVLARAAEIIVAGGLVAFPTETVYGLGANAFDASAVERVFRAKGRPASDPLIVHVLASWPLDLVFGPARAEPLPALLQTLADRFWPGPLTLVAPRSARIADRVTAGRATVAVRAPAHPVAAGLIGRSGVPIVAPSANRFGYVSPTDASHVYADLGDACDLILDAGRTPLGIESTVVLVEETNLVVLRQGAVTVEDLRRAVPHVVVELASAATSPSLSPGRLDRHYAPMAPTIAITAHVVEQLATAAFLETAAPGVCITLTGTGALPTGWRWVRAGSHEDLHGVAHHLYDVLRTVDADRPRLVLVELTGRAGLGAAVDDRLRRAAAGRVAATVDELVALVDHET